MGQEQYPLHTMMLCGPLTSGATCRTQSPPMRRGGLLQTLRLSCVHEAWLQDSTGELTDGAISFHVVLHNCKHLSLSSNKQT